MTPKPFYINGRHVSSGTTHAVNNPWDGTRLVDVCVANAAQVEEMTEPRCLVINRG